MLCPFYRYIDKRAAYALPPEILTYGDIFYISVPVPIFSQFNFSDAFIVLVVKIYYLISIVNMNEGDVPEEVQEQPDLFADHEALAKQKAAEDAELVKERRLQDALLSIKKQFGKNAVLKAMSLQEGATAKDRNQQVGGHKA